MVTQGLSLIDKDDLLELIDCLRVVTDQYEMIELALELLQAGRDNQVRIIIDDHRAKMEWIKDELRARLERTRELNENNTFNVIVSNWGD